MEETPVQIRALADSRPPGRLFIADLRQSHALTKPLSASNRTLSSPPNGTSGHWRIKHLLRHRRQSMKNETSRPSYGLDDDLIVRKAFGGLFSVNLTTGEVRYVDPQSGNNDVSCHSSSYLASSSQRS